MNKAVETLKVRHQFACNKGLSQRCRIECEFYYVDEESGCISRCLKKELWSYILYKMEEK